MLFCPVICVIIFFNGQIKTRKIGKVICPCGKIESQQAKGESKDGVDEDNR